MVVWNRRIEGILSISVVSLYGFFMVQPNPYLKQAQNTPTALKQALRLDMMARRKELSSEERAIAAFRITESLSELPEFQQANFVHIYCSFGAEVSSGEILDLAFRTRKRILVPITPVPKHYRDNDEADKTLLHTEINNEQSFGYDRYGIPVPLPPDDALWLEYCKPTELFTLADCIIVPLIAFDATCHRIGYGGGFYDRFLSAFDAVQCVKIGVAFECQHVECIPKEPHDEPLSLVITEKAVYRRSL